MRKLFLPILAFVMLLSNVLTAQNTTNIPLNKNVKYGKLKNGMTYYIMHNEEPKDRASFYFVQNVGAILEKDEQNGLAHFLEHMAFNGLEHFPGKNMLNYLEKNGILFGRDINAGTSQDETVYNISNIPTNRKALMDSTLLVLHDWSGYLLLEGDEIDAERGVIREEWRTRRNVRKRLNDQSSPVLYNHSQYAKRDVIGSLDVINNFKHKALRDYYKKWYRPDLQAVVVVGDFDVDRMEKKIKEIFLPIPMPKNAAKRVYYEIEDTNEIGFVIAKDKEATSVSLNWIFRVPTNKNHDEKYIRDGLVHNMFNNLINNRLNELTQKPDCPAIGFGLGNFSLARTKDANYLAVSPKEGKILESFEVLMTEFLRVRQFGFTKSELDRVKKQYLRSYESHLESKDKISNEDWVEGLQEHFLSAEPVRTVEDVVAFAQKEIPTITLQEVNAVVNGYNNIGNSVIIEQGPDKESVKYATLQELMSVVEKVSKQQLTAYDDGTSDTPLVTDKLTAKKVVSEKKMKGADATIYTLENGAKVVLMPTDYSKDDIMFSAYSFGGTSLVNTADLESANMASTVAAISGVGDFNAIQLRKKLAGKLASARPYVGGLTEGFSGSASPKDFETMLQLIYQKMVHPRFDKEVFNAQMARMRNSLKNIEMDNNKAFGDTIKLVSSNYNERTLLFGEKFVNNINFDKAKQIYKERFANAADFTFFFVGNIDVKRDLPLICKYIGNLPSQNGKENYVNHNVKPAKGDTKRDFKRAMQTPKTTVYLELYKNIEYNQKNRMYVSVLSQLLSKRYTETIREQEGGSYGVGVSPSIRKYPTQLATLTINFDCNPEKQARLREIVFEEIDRLKKTVKADDLEEIKKNYIKNREEAVKENSFWMNVIESSLMYNETITSTKDYVKLVNSINVKEVKKFANKFFKNYDTVEVVMNPEK